MHHSRLFGLFVDTPSDQAPAAVAFWSAALGARAETVPGEEEFTTLAGAVPGLTVDVQAVDDAPRYHVDIETDDVEAEVARLTALGAVEVRPGPGFQTLRAPGGHLLCVVPVQSDPAFFVANCRAWP
jgi:hypothetical protein